MTRHTHVRLTRGARFLVVPMLVWLEADRRIAEGYPDFARLPKLDAPALTLVSDDEATDLACLLDYLIAEDLRRHPERESNVALDTEPLVLLSAFMANGWSDDSAFAVRAWRERP